MTTIHNMPPQRRTPSPKPTTRRSPPDRAEGTAAVDAFPAASRHPLTAELQLVRGIVRAADPSIREEVKWNAPGFRASESFATLNGPRHVEHVMIVLHTGARKKGADLRSAVADPEGLLAWRGTDRAIVTLRNAAEIRARQSAIQALVRSWIRAV